MLASGYHTVASSGRDSSVRIWDLRDAREIDRPQNPPDKLPKKLVDHSGEAITAITSARLGKYSTPRLVVGRRNGNIQRYILADGDLADDQVHVHPSGVRFMTELRTSDEKHYVATVGNDNAVRVWDFAGVDPVAELPRSGNGEIRALTAIHRNGRDTLLAVGDSTGLVRIWDVHGRRKTRLIDAHDGPVTSMAAVQIDYHTTRLLTGGADRRIRFWDPDTGEHDSGPDITGWTSPIFTMAVLPGLDGPVLAAGGHGSVRRFDLVTRSSLGGLGLPGKDTTMTRLASLTTVTGKPMLVGVGRQHAIRVWRPAAAELVHHLNVPGPVLASHAFGQHLVLSTSRGLCQFSLSLPDYLAEGLTPRDIEVLREISLGYSSVEAGRHLSVTSRSVNQHIRGICRKLGTSDRDEAVLMARAQGLIA